MSRLLSLILFIGLSLPFAFCEIGTKSNQSFIQGGYRVVYSFPSRGENVALRFAMSETIPFSIYYDFQTMQFCR